MIAYPSNNRVTLVWDSASDAETFIKHYRVYYGLDPANFEYYVDTKDASITWYVPDLDNGKPYYFAVTAFDTDGMESADKSTTVSSTPFTTEVSALGQVTGALGAHAAAVQETVIPPTNSETGPELLWFAGASGVLSLFGRKLRRARRK